MMSARSVFHSKVWHFNFLLYFILLYNTINVDWQLSIHFVIHLIIVIFPILTIIDLAFRGLTFRVLLVGIVVNNFRHSYVDLGVDSLVVVPFLLEDLALNSPEKRHGE